ncbi:MAG: hypothetical protein JSS34_08110 [Proteobacteria bacterium]|nr:hypothetical protein [Pseudomonadota bacterium]
MSSFLKHVFFGLFLSLSSLHALEDEAKPSAQASSSFPVLDVSEMIRLSATKKDPDAPLDIFTLQNSSYLGMGHTNLDTLMTVSKAEEDLIFML